MFIIKYRKSLLWRLGLKRLVFTIPKGRRVIWIHAVSLGETKTGLIFLEKLKKDHPDFFIVYSTITETGMSAIVENQLVDLPAYLPLDFSRNIQRLMKKIRPDFVFLVESDFWPHFLKFAKRYGKIFLISGRLSERSFKRFKLVSFFTKRIFSHFDHICVQNDDAYQKFLGLKIPKSKITITGNLKYDQKRQFVDLIFWKRAFNICKDDFVITIASTHEMEETLILDQLKSLFDRVKILIAPRHPERFGQVGKTIEKYQKDRIILVDKMGVLPSCFQLSQVAIMGGSFIKGIGGHNILEPCTYQTPVLFGPNMEGQKELVSIVRAYRLGWQVREDELVSKVESLMAHPFKQDSTFIHKIQGSSKKILDTLEPYLKLRL